MWFCNKISNKHFITISVYNKCFFVWQKNLTQSCLIIKQKEKVSTMLVHVAILVEIGYLYSCMNQSLHVLLCRYI